MYFNRRAHHNVLAISANTVGKNIVRSLPLNSSQSVFAATFTDNNNYYYCYLSVADMSCAKFKHWE